MTIKEMLMSLELGLIYSIVAIGVYLTFRVIKFQDLTCDGSFVFGSALSVIFTGFSLPLAFIGGVLAGLFTGFLRIFFNMTDLLSGILVAFMLYSINLHVMGGMPNIVITKSIFTDHTVIFTILFIVFFISILISYLLSTDFGLSLISVGQNVTLCKSVGVNINYIILFCLALSNGLIGFAGGILTHYQEFSDINGGIGTVIVGLASIMIGEKIVPNYPIIGCVVGSVLYRFFISIALHSDLLGFETYDINLLTGILIITIMSLPGKKKTC